MPSEPASVTQADQVLIADMLALGASASPRQLKDWRAAGLVPTPIRETRGRGRGRPSTTYPEGTTRRVIDILDIQNQTSRVALRDIPVWLFILNKEVDLDDVRESFALHDAGFLTGLGFTGPDDLIDGIEPLARRGLHRNTPGRLLMMVLNVRSVRRDSRIANLLTQVITSFVDATSSDAAMTKLAGLLGFGKQDRALVSELMKPMLLTNSMHASKI